MRRLCERRRVGHAALLCCAAALGAGCGESTVHTAKAGPATASAAGSAPGTVTPASTAPAPPAKARPAAGAPTSPTAFAGSIPARPPIVQSPIPFGAARRAQMAAYAQRHYGFHSYLLREPHVIVIHYTETPSFQSTFNTFAPDVPDSELHELPNTCAHFVIEKNGTIHQLVPLQIMCRHTVGLNWTAIGIEHVGSSDAEVLGAQRQMRASLRLVRWLRCTFQIKLADVIGHNESLSSRFHHENVPALRTQTHSDFNHADMNVYRSRLRAAGGC
jgi:N-acetylmuramoyl-L-alanine amidase